jgi:hypothetical protein
MALIHCRTQAVDAPFRGMDSPLRVIANSRRAPKYAALKKLSLSKRIVTQEHLAKLVRRFLLLSYCSCPPH